MYYTISGTPAGPLIIQSDGTTITGIHWQSFKRAPKITSEWQEDPGRFEKVLAQLAEYFKGHRKTFDFTFKLQGTAFQRAVWQELAKIPYGQKQSYQQIAHAVGLPKAVRAVGTAVGSNPLAIVIPCHRVLTASGKLGGYAGGLDSKEILLHTEGIPYSPEMIR